MNSRVVSVASTPTLLSDQGGAIAALSVNLVNNGAQTVTLGGAAVVAGAGYQLAAGKQVTVALTNGDKLYGITASSTSNVGVLETTVAGLPPTPDIGAVLALGGLDAGGYEIQNVGAPGSTGSVASRGFVEARTLPQMIRSVSVGYAASVTPNAGTTDVLNIAALTGGITVANPSGSPVDGQLLTVRLVQDSSGGHAVAWGSAFAFGTDVASASVPTTASAKCELVFEWCAADSKWRAVRLVRGF